MCTELLCSVKESKFNFFTTSRYRSLSRGQKFVPLLWQQKDNRITVAALLLAAVEALIHQMSKIILLLPPPPASSSSLLLLLRGVLLLQYKNFIPTSAYYIIQKLYSNFRLLHCTKYLLSLPSLYYSTIVHVILPLHNAV